MQAIMEFTLILLELLLFCRSKRYQINAICDTILDILLLEPYERRDHKFSIGG